MPKFRVSGDVRHAFVHVIEAPSIEEATEAVEQMSHRDLDNVATGNMATMIEVQDAESIDE